MGLYKNLAISPDKLRPDNVDWDAYAGTEADRPLRASFVSKGDDGVVGEDGEEEELDGNIYDDDDNGSVEVDSDDEEAILSSEFAALGFEDLRSQILSNAHALALTERRHLISGPVPPLQLVIRRHGDIEFMAMVLQDRLLRLASAGTESAQQAMMSLLELTAELLEEARLDVEKIRVGWNAGAWCDDGSNKTARRLAG